MRYAITTNTFVTGAVAGTYLAALAAKAGATSRGRLIEIHASGRGTPVDEQIGVRLLRSNNVADGTGTAIIPSKLAADGRASGMTCKENLTVNPTTEDTVYEMETEFNHRGQLVLPVGHLGIEWGSAETIQLQFTPGSANARNVTATLIWED